MLEVSIPIAYELLAQCIKQGQALVQRASLVGDFSDYESWKSARKQWIDPTTQALAHMYDGTREVRDFAETVTCAEGGKRWQDQYAADLDCVKRAIDLLTLLQGELAFDAQRPAAVEQTVEPLRADTIGAAEHGLPEPELQERELPGRELAQAAIAELSHEEDKASGLERRDEPSPLGALATEQGREDVIEDSGEPRQSPAQPVGSELAARAPLVGSELASQQDPAAPAERVESSAPAPAPAQTREVLLARGRDEHWAQAVAHLLEQSGSHELTILDQRGTQRAALLEGAEERLAGRRYAVVLLTADDIGGPREDSAEEPYFAPRARQQVVFEMGFLAAALTPARVCVLYEEGVELPCELDGIAHVRLDLAGTWQPKLLMKLRRAGFDYDLNRLVSA
jgi:predicted nucleotide-binding protein